MNPYDFARIDWDIKPERRKPIWHHRFTGPGTERLYSGTLEVEAFAETPLFIGDPRTASSDPRRPALSIRNKQGKYILPGSSLKGMLRNVVETLGNGCLTLFDSRYERDKSGRDTVQYQSLVPANFQHCSSNTELCISCRIFGMLKERTNDVFLGKINIGDAICDEEHLANPFYTKPLLTPKPHHTSFYLDEGERHIAGRKFYFHMNQVLTDRSLVMMSGKPANRYIQPLDYDTRFHFQIEFTNLEADEFAVLLFSVMLEEEMRHKIGYGKPLGLGSISLVPRRLTLIDYAARYTAGTINHGVDVLEENTLGNLIEDQEEYFRESVAQKKALEDLRRIWRWPADSDVDYYYPSKRDWFGTPDSIGKRIADTKNVPG